MIQYTVVDRQCRLASTFLSFSTVVFALAWTTQLCGVERSVLHVKTGQLNANA